MKIGLVVSGQSHLKTEQLALELAASGRHDLSIVTVPFLHRKPRTPSFIHRPDQNDSVPLAELAAGLGATLVETSGLDGFVPEGFDLFIMTGGVLLPKEFLERVCGRVLNCHPGIIPQVRGLDAFKWAILEGEEVGNTLHYINSEVDMGDILARIPTPVFHSDSLRQFADRHYAAEIRILAQFEQFIGAPTIDANQLGPIGDRHMRMNAEKEADLLDVFEVYKQRFAKPGVRS